MKQFSQVVDIKTLVSDMKKVTLSGTPLLQIAPPQLVLCPPTPDNICSTSSPATSLSESLFSRGISTILNPTICASAKPTPNSYVPDHFFSIDDLQLQNYAGGATPPAKSTPGSSVLDYLFPIVELKPQNTATYATPPPSVILAFQKSNC